MLAVNLFHMRGGKIVDRRDMFWEDLPEFEEAQAEEPGHRVSKTWDGSPNPALARRCPASAGPSEQHGVRRLR